MELEVEKIGKKVPDALMFVKNKSQISAQMLSMIHISLFSSLPLFLFFFRLVFLVLFFSSAYGFYCCAMFQVHPSMGGPKDDSSGKVVTLHCDPP